jgi:hypothetical protein
MRISLKGSVVLVALLSMSCSRNDGAQRHRFKITSADGIEIAANSGGPIYQGEIFRYEPVQVLRPDPEIPESFLHRPGAIVIDDEGYFYVCENGGRRVVVFDPEGRYVKSFGGEGGGPGEFRSIALIAWSDELLTFYDGRLRRVTEYSTDGVLSHIYSQPLTSVGRVFYPVRGGASVILNMRIERRGIDSWQAMESIVIDADGDTLSVLQPPTRPFQRSLRDLEVAFVWSYNVYPKIVYRPGEGIVVYDAESPVLNWYSLSGELTRRIDVGLPRISVSAEQRRQVREYWNERIRNSEGEAQRQVKAVRNNLAFGDFIPYWDHFLIDDAGYYWLEVYETTQQKQEAGGAVFRVLSARGEYLGDTRWPVPIAGSYMIEYPLVVKGHLVAIVRDSETQENIPTVFRITPVAEGLKYP